MKKILLSTERNIQYSNTLSENSSLPSAVQCRQDVEALERAFGHVYSGKFSCSTSVSVTNEESHSASDIIGEDCSLETMGSKLLYSDKILSRTFYADQSITSLYRALVQLSATSRLQQSEALFSSFLSWCRKAAAQPILIECGLAKYFGVDAQNRQNQGSQKRVTLAMVFGWATKNKKGFRNFQKMLQHSTRTLTSFL